MSGENAPLHLPNYNDFVAGVEVLSLHITVSELHGLLCGYLCAGAAEQGENFMRALMNNKKDKARNKALVSLFSVFSTSQQQISSFDFSFEMLLPSEDSSLFERAEAFTQWCDGFIKGLNLADIDEEQFHEEEALEAYLHIAEFSNLDCESLQINEEDEKALMEIYEYTRLAVLRLHGDLVANKKDQSGTKITH